MYTCIYIYILTTCTPIIVCYPNIQGRCPEVYSQLVARVQEHNKTVRHNITISIEVEKTKINFSTLLPLADVVSGH